MSVQCGSVPLCLQRLMGTMSRLWTILMGSEIGGPKRGNCKILDVSFQTHLLQHQHVQQLTYLELLQNPTLCCWQFYYYIFTLFVHNLIIAVILWEPKHRKAFDNLSQAFQAHNPHLKGFLPSMWVALPYICVGMLLKQEAEETQHYYVMLHYTDIT